MEQTYNDSWRACSGVKHIFRMPFIITDYHSPPTKQLVASTMSYSMIPPELKQNILILYQITPEKLKHHSPQSHINL